MNQDSLFAQSKKTARKILLAFYTLNCFAVSCFIYAQTAEPPKLETLELNKPVEKEIAAGKIQKFQTTLGENQYASVLVEQRGIDIVVRVFNEVDERPMAQRDLTTGISGREELGFTAAKAGVYRFEVEARMVPSPTGRYGIWLAEVRPPTEKELRLEEARRLHNETHLLWKAGKFAEALPVGERALAMRVKELGEEHIDVSSSVSQLGLIYLELGDYEKGLELYKRSVAIREKISGPDHADLASPISNIGVIYRVLADHTNAEPYLRRALAIREKTLPPNHQSLAFTLGSLGDLYLDKGDYEKSLEYGLRSVSVTEKSLGLEHPNLVNPLGGVGNAYNSRGEYESAQKYYERAIHIAEKNFGPDHPRTGDSLGNSGISYLSQGDYAKAEPLLLRTLDIVEKSLGKEHRSYALVTYNLASLYTETGNYQKAEGLYKESIEVTEKLFGSRHSLVLLFMNGLARNYEAKGEIAQALETIKRTRQIREQYTPLVFTASSERQKLSYLRNNEFYETNLNISTHARLAPDNPQALEFSLSTILERKGRVSDAMATEFAALRRRFNANDQILLDDLKETTTQLARKILNETPRVKPEEHQKQIKELEDKKEKLEIEISRRSSEFRSQLQPVTIAAIQSLVPENAALVEFGTYYPYEPKLHDSKAYGEPRYIAYVLRQTGKIGWTDLGEVKTIKAAIDDFRNALSDSKSKNVKPLARAVDEKVMKPVRALTGNASQILISPDGELNLIPFEALVDEKNDYLIENYSFTYLTSGRDLMRMQIPREKNNNAALIIANPSFGNPPAQISNPGTTSRSDLAETYFVQLKGTMEEARAIRNLFPNAAVLTDNQATETAFKQAVAPSILHVATHGFFLQDEAQTNPSTRNRGSERQSEVKNPLLRSGLAFAGANRRDGTDDGILTALEASNLNLWGTKLVVLSACDTGVGEVKNNEGVYGLRRAFFLSGTESLVMSLWSISDQVTRELMTNYYKNLKLGMGRGAALRKVQLEMLKKENRQHPFYWAAFIQSGEWANLEGKR